MLDNVDPAYRHRPKQAHAGAPLRIGALHLKWFDLDELAYPVTPAIREMARGFVASQTPVPGDRAGFVILHRCGESFHFLLTALWRGNNELWQAVHYFDATTDGFAAFPPAYPVPGALRPTFCVWELGIVAAEAMAWQRYLSSDREAADFALWQQDISQGPV